MSAMRRLLSPPRHPSIAAVLAVCGGLCFGAVPSAAGRLTAPPCSRTGITLAVHSQGENTTTWIGVDVAARSATCSLSGVATIAVIRRGSLLPVSGNPLHVRAFGALARGRSQLLRADWSNWCGDRAEIAVRVSYLGRRATLRPIRAPVCLDVSKRSRLAVIR
jgi:hypothetical protein